MGLGFERYPYLGPIGAGWNSLPLINHHKPSFAVEVCAGALGEIELSEVTCRSGSADSLGLGTTAIVGTSSTSQIAWFLKVLWGCPKISKHKGTPQSIHFTGIVQYKPSSELGVPPFYEPPHPPWDDPVQHQKSSKAEDEDWGKPRSRGAPSAFPVHRRHLSLQKFAQIQLSSVFFLDAEK